MSEAITLAFCGARCLDGGEHDFQGNRPILDEHGREIGGEAVCLRCGMGAMEHSLWTDDG